MNNVYFPNIIVSVICILNISLFSWHEASGAEQITDNTGHDYHPSLYNGTVAWCSDIDGDFEIYYWDGSYNNDGKPIIQQISNNSYPDYRPSLYNGKIAWSGDIDGDQEIFYWDGSYDIDGKPVVQQISNNTIDDHSPSLNKGAIAWDTSHSIQYWDGSYDVSGNPTIQQIASGYSTRSASLHNGRIAYTSGIDNNQEIYYWNGTFDSVNNPIIRQITHTDRQIGNSNQPVWNINPSLYNDTVAWQSNLDGDEEIYYWNGLVDGNGNPVIQQITNNVEPDTEPSLFNGTIAWQAYPAGESHPSGKQEVVYWDGSLTSDGQAVIREISQNDDYEDTSASLYGGSVAYCSDIDGDSEIYYYKFNSPPVADFGRSRFITECDTLTLDGSSSYDMDGMITSWDWELLHHENQSFDRAVSGEIATIPDLEVGFYLVTLTIKDDFGNTDDELILIGVTQSADVNGDCHQGLEEVLSILNTLAGN